MFKSNLFGEEIYIDIKDHLYKKRSYSRKERGVTLTESRIEEIVKMGLKEGGTESHNRKDLGILFRDYNGKSCALLCNYSGNTVHVITYINTRKHWSNIFSRDKSVFTVFIPYILPKMTEGDLFEKKMETLARKAKLIYKPVSRVGGLRIKKKAKGV